MHARASRALAEEYFETSAVVGRTMSDFGEENRLDEFTPNKTGRHDIGCDRRC
jgi:hypothetical protein